MSARNVLLILTILTALPVALVGHYFASYMPSDDVWAIDWLAGHAGEEAVLLSSYGIGNYWVAHSEGRAFLGHQFAVLGPAIKDRARPHLFSETADEGEQRQLVTRYGITHVFYGSLECDLGDASPSVLPWLMPVHHQGEAIVHRVVP